MALLERSSKAAFGSVFFGLESRLLVDSAANDLKGLEPIDRMHPPGVGGGIAPRALLAPPPAPLVHRPPASKA